jgi:hypothetical protein
MIMENKVLINSVKVPLNLRKYQIKPEDPEQSGPSAT